MYFLLYFVEHHKFTSAAAKLQAFCSKELKFMNNCENCFENFYKNPGEWLFKACDYPHLVLWVDITNYDFWPADKGFKYWPAKALAVDESGIAIVFFGHHQFATVSTNDCYLYSSPSSYFSNMTTDRKDIATAIEVMSLIGHSHECSLEKYVC